MTCVTMLLTEADRTICCTSCVVASGFSALVVLQEPKPANRPGLVNCLTSFPESFS